MRLLAAALPRALRLVEQPPLITSVVTNVNVLAISSYVTGLQTRMAAWNGDNIQYFMVARRWLPFPWLSDRPRCSPSLSCRSRLILHTRRGVHHMSIWSGLHHTVQHL